MSPSVVYILTILLVCQKVFFFASSSSRLFFASSSGRLSEILLLELPFLRVVAAMPAKGRGSAPERVRPWELYAPTDPGYAPAGGADDFGGWDEEVPEGVSPEVAGENLASLLVDLKLKGILSAKHVCVLAHWATLAGAKGPCKDFAAKPGGQSGSYQQRLNTFLRVEEHAPFYTVRLPGTDPALAERTTLDMAVMPPHEAISQEVLDDPGILQRAQELAGAEEWGAVYRSHPAVTTAPPGTPVLPLAIYADGVPFTKTDGFVAFWTYNLLTSRRHLLAVLRKTELCDCGCKRWCTFHGIFQFLRWSFAALAVGQHPEGRHDGEAWMPADFERAARAGTPLARGAVVLLKGDWAEFCHTFGFPTWASGISPCIFCKCNKEGLYLTDNLSIASFPHELKDMAGYSAACAACENWVTMTQEQHAAVVPLLAWDRRKDTEQ